MINCEVCGEPMPLGEEMFKYHGYSGKCPKPPLKREGKPTNEELESELATIRADHERIIASWKAEENDWREMNDRLRKWKAEALGVLEQCAAVFMQDDLTHGNINSQRMQQLCEETINAAKRETVPCDDEGCEHYGTPHEHVVAVQINAAGRESDLAPAWGHSAVPVNAAHSGPAGAAPDVEWLHYFIDRIPYDDPQSLAEVNRGHRIVDALASSDTRAKALREAAAICFNLRVNLKQRGGPADSVTSARDALSNAENAILALIGKEGA
jgi:hypothetical protein